MNELGLAGLLIIAIMGSTGMSYFQHRSYIRKVNQLIRDHPGDDLTLVSGRRKGKVHGAVALLMVRDGSDPEIVRALTMEGASVFARFRERPEFCGPASQSPTGVPRARRLAVEDAIARYHDMKRDAAGRHLAPPGPRALA